MAEPAYLKQFVALTLTLSPMPATADATGLIDLSVVTSPFPEFALTAGPDGYYLTRQAGRWGEGSRSEILFFGDDGATSNPSWANPSADESSFYYSGKQEFGCFVSDRDSPPAERNGDVWCVAWLGDDWGKPYRLPAPVNSEAAEFSPVVRDDGSLLFASDRPGGAGLGDFYVATPNGSSWRVASLGNPVNTSGGEWNLEISPDGDFLLFEASHRSSNRTVPGDLYVSLSEPDGWGDAVPLSLLNTDGSDLMPRFLSTDTIAYSTSVGGDADVHIVPTEHFFPVTPMVAAVSRSDGQVTILDPGSLQTVRRIDVGAGPHDIASSEDGRVAVVPLFGIHPRSHENPIPASELKWQVEPSEGMAILDLSGNTEIKTLALDDCARPHGAAATAQADRVWITCENEGQIREINPSTGQTIRTINVGTGVHKVMYLQNVALIAATNPDTGDTYVIEVDSGQFTRIRTGAGAEALAASDDQSTIYVANSQDQTVCEIDVANRTLVSCVPSGGKFPIALAVDALAGRLWVAHNSSSELTAISLADGKVSERIPLPSPLLGMAFDARHRAIYVGLPRRNEILRIDADTFEVTASNGSIGEIDDIDLVSAAYFRFAPDT